MGHFRDYFTRVRERHCFLRMQPLDQNALSDRTREVDLGVDLDIVPEHHLLFVLDKPC
jgi:hypothetical protein